MKTTPILFTGPNVNAISEDRKTQTRRLVFDDMDLDKRYEFRRFNEVAKKQRDGKLRIEWRAIFDLKKKSRKRPLLPPTMGIKCPYGGPGDRLWIRETWLNHAIPGYPPVYFYRADSPDKPSDRKWQPSIFMPRDACRQELEIVSLRVERVKSISEEDAMAEGIIKTPPLPSSGKSLYLYDPNGTPGREVGGTAVEAYAHLWESINFKRGFGWNKNPLVWVITFRKV